ncbi:filamin-B-like isoform X2 [Dysidea avara]|uniref:filamin-B-like isoform X2 n=1 Tax=Dysidea avara TaxID=196820 RepID=UPI00331A4055
MSTQCIEGNAEEAIGIAPESTPKWVEFQKATFTKWIKKVLKGVSHTYRGDDIQTDFRDGLALIALLETISNKKVHSNVGRINKNPTNQYQMRENLDICLEFMKDQNFSLVHDISALDIYNGVLNLILGLIYSLIYRYHIQKKVKERPSQISSAKSVNVSASTALLSWIDWKVAKYIPKGKKIRNLNTDWNDGIALCALIESIKEGTCPECTKLSGDDRLDNCKKGLRLGKKHFKIPRIISPEHLSHREIDETSVMVYLCYYLRFCFDKPKPPPDVPEHIVQFLDDAGLVEFAPSKLDSKQAKVGVDVPQPADASKCIVDLTFLRRSVFTVGEPIIFTVDCTNAGKGHLDIKAYATANREKNIATKRKKSFTAGVSIFDCFLKAETVGTHELVIQWEGNPITADSPLRFEVCNPKAIVLENLQSRHNTFVGDTIKFDVDISKAGSADILQAVFSDEKRKCEKILTDSKVTFIYHADTIGSTELSIYFNNLNMKTIEIVVASDFLSSSPNREMQLTFFTNYINYVFKRSSKGAVSNLQWGFQSGVSLASLLEQFSGKKIDPVKSVIAEAENRSQMIYNLKLCFAFMKSEELQISDIDAEDIYDGNSEAILKMLWEIIKFYHIGHHNTTVTVEEAMLIWFRTVLSKTTISNFTTDWYDGILLCCLVEVLQPGLCPQCSLLQASTANENCGLAIELARSNLGIPAFVSADMLHKRNLDEKCMMIYLAFFIQHAKTSLLTWLQSILPNRNITNLTTDWRDGISLVALCTLLCPGALPAWHNFKVTDPTYNLTLAMKVAGEKLNIKSEPTFLPSQFIGPRIDELTTSAYLYCFRYASARVDASKCKVTFEDDKLINVKQPIKFSVEYTGTGTGDIKLYGQDPRFTRLLLLVNKDSFLKDRNVYNIQSNPPTTLIGVHNIAAFWNNIAIPGSPFVFHTADPDLVYIRELPEEKVNIGKEMVFVVDAEKAGNGKLVILAIGVENAAEDILFSEYVCAVVEIKYTPATVGPIEFLFTFNGVSIKRWKCEVTELYTSADLTSTNIKENYSGTIEAPSKSQLQNSNDNMEIFDMFDALLSDQLNNPPDDIKTFDNFQTQPNDQLQNLNSEIHQSQAKVDDSLLNIETDNDSLKAQVRNLLHNPGHDAEISESSQAIISSTHSDNAIDSDMLDNLQVQIGNQLQNLTTASNYSKCQIQHAGLNEDHIINKPVEFSVDVSDAGIGPLTNDVIDPNGSHVQMYSHVNETEGITHHLCFIPTILGKYTVNILWNDQVIPGAPFDVNVVDPSKCIIKGLPLKDNIAILNKDISYRVITKGAGAGTVQSIICRTGQKSISLVPTKQKNDVYTFEYKPCEVGKFDIVMLFSKKELSGSPFTSVAIDVDSTEIILLSDLAILNECYNFYIQGSHAYNTVIYDPLSNQVDVRLFKEKHYSVASFTPPLIGSYVVFVEHDDKQIPNTPFLLWCIDPSKCELVGDLPAFLQVGKVTEFMVTTADAGLGLISVLIDGEEENQTCPAIVDTQQDHSLHKVALIPKHIGDVSIQVLFAGHEIPTMLFKALICDVSQCKIIGEFRQDKSFPIGKEITFTLVTTGAGFGEAVVKVHSPTMQHHLINVKKVKRETFQCAFTPLEVGELSLDVMWGTAHVPGSPYKIIVDGQSDMTCTANGSGLRKATAGKPAYFTITANESGLTENGTLFVSIKTRGFEAEVHIDDNGSSIYDVNYTAAESGAYEAEIKCHGEHIVGSPFKIVVAQDGDAAKCQVTGIMSGDDRYTNTVQEFFIDTSECGNGTLKVTIRDPNDEKVDSFIDKEVEDKYSIKCIVENEGIYTISVLWSEIHVPGSPFKLNIKQLVAANAAMVKAYGPGLYNAKIQEWAEFIISTKQAGNGILAVSALSAKGSFVVNLEPKESDIYTARYNPSIVGSVYIFIKWSGFQIPGSPFKVYIADAVSNSTVASTLASSDFSKCRIQHDDLNEGHNIDKPMEFSVDVSDAGIGSLTSSVIDPKGSQVQVYSDVNESEGVVTHNLCVIPKLLGKYTVTVLWNDQAIPGTPFDVIVINLSKCIVKGLPLKDNIATLNKDISYRVITRGAGTGTVQSIICRPGQKSIALKPARQENDVYTFEYKPSEVGKFEIVTLFCKKELSESPYTCVTIDIDSTEVILLSNVACFGEVYKFYIQGSHSYAVSVYDPQNNQLDATLSKEKNFAVAYFIPTLIGSYVVFIEYDGQQIPKSPFLLRCIDPSKCKALGDFPVAMQVGKVSEFIVTSADAGLGNISLLIDNKRYNHICRTKVNSQQDVCLHKVSLIPRCVGEISVQVLFAGHRIPSMVFKSQICDANVCQVTTDFMKAGNCTVGKVVTFTVVVTGAGLGKTVIKVHGPTTHQYTVNINKSQRDTFHCAFIPVVEGEHLIEVMWGIAHVPGSPFRFIVDKPSELVCTANGSGLNQAVVGIPAKFSIITNESGLLNSGALFVSVRTIHCEAKTEIDDNGDGNYDITFTVQEMGAYIAEIKLRGQPILGSPFKIGVVQGTDASKCQVSGIKSEGYQYTNVPQEFYIDTSQGGSGTLMVTVRDPNDQQVNAYTKKEDKGRFSVKFITDSEGIYTVNVLWSEVHVPGSPFKVHIKHAVAPNAKMVKAYGPGLHNGKLHEWAEFRIVAKQAGQSTLTVNVHSIKGTFEIPVQPKGPDTYIARYNPSIVGDVFIIVRWGGVQIPGSPFKVKIADSAPLASKAVVIKPVTKLEKEDHSKVQDESTLISVTTSKPDMEQCDGVEADPTINIKQLLQSVKSDLESYQGIKDASSQDGDRASFENQNIIGKKLYKAQNDILQLQKSATSQHSITLETLLNELNRLVSIFRQILNSFDKQNALESSAVNPNMRATTPRIAVVNSVVATPSVVKAEAAHSGDSNRSATKSNSANPRASNSSVNSQSSSANPQVSIPNIAKPTVSNANSRIANPIVTTSSISTTATTIQAPRVKPAVVNSTKSTKPKVTNSSDPSVVKPAVVNSSKSTSSQATTTSNQRIVKSVAVNSSESIKQKVTTSDIMQSNGVKSAVANSSKSASSQATNTSDQRTVKSVTVNSSQSTNQQATNSSAPNPTVPKPSITDTNAYKQRVTNPRAASTIVAGSNTANPSSTNSSVAHSSRATPVKSVSNQREANPNPERTNTNVVVPSITNPNQSASNQSVNNPRIANSSVANTATNSRARITNPGVNNAIPRGVANQRVSNQSTSTTNQDSINSDTTNIRSPSNASSNPSVHNPSATNSRVTTPAIAYPRPDNTNVSNSRVPQYSYPSGTYPGVASNPNIPNAKVPYPTVADSNPRANNSTSPPPYSSYYPQASSNSVIVMQQQQQHQSRDAAHYKKESGEFYGKDTVRLINTPVAVSCLMHCCHMTCTIYIP